MVTTTTPDNVTALFRHSFGAFEEDWFELVAAGGIVQNKKPAPDASSVRPSFLTKNRIFSLPLIQT